MEIAKTEFSLESKHRKFSLRCEIIDDIDANDLFEQMSKSYGLYYIGIYNLKDNIFIYVNLKNAIKGRNIKTFVEELGIKIHTVQLYKHLVGTIQSEKGDKFITGGNRKRKSPTTINNTTINNNNGTINNNTINVVMVNPIGHESLDHITPEYIQSLLDGGYDTDVMFTFGTELYSVPENMNFKTAPKDGYVKYLDGIGSDRGWDIGSKKLVFPFLVDVLTSKNQEAVELHRDGLTKDSLDNFQRSLTAMEDIRNEGTSKELIQYKRLYYEHLTSISEKMKSHKKKLERETGKRIKFE